MEIGRFEKQGKEAALLKLAIPGLGLVQLEAKPADGETNGDKPVWRLYYEGCECGAMWRKHKREQEGKKPYYTGSCVMAGWPDGIRFFVFSNGDGEAGKIVLYRKGKAGSNDSDF